MKQLTLLLALLYSPATEAQVTKVNFQASGLTCSMCSNAINKSLKTLDFIAKIDADVKHSAFELTFKPNSDVDFDKIKNSVEDAGFSISSLFATLQFENTQVGDQPIKVGFFSLLVVNSKSATLNGETRVQLLDKGFVSSKEFKHNSFPKSGERLYHVTL